MKKNKKSYTIFQNVTAVFMMLVLCWLTVSAPFVWASQQELAKQQKMTAEVSQQDSCPDEESNSSNNNIEEKVPSTTNLSEEFLHDHHTTDCLFSIISTFHKHENDHAYLAFHGELLVPPPNVA